MKRTSIHLDEQDMKVLERLAREESTRCGSTITGAMIVRRLIREYVLRLKGKK